MPLPVLSGPLWGTGRWIVCLIDCHELIDDHPILSIHVLAREAIGHDEIPLALFGGQGLKLCKRLLCSL
eukprot:319734-Karenia_brevis.AAC.1